jgi:hypothetical protein
MGLLDALRGGVAVANTVTKQLQGTVMYSRFQSDPTGSGDRTYFQAPSQQMPGNPLPAVPLQAIVEWKQRVVRTRTGELAVSSSNVLLLDVAALAAATGGNGIGPFDVLVLPDGTTGPILNISGFMDSGTTQPLATQVFLG